MDNGRIRGLFGLNGSKKLIRHCDVGFRCCDVNIPSVEENVSFTSRHASSNVTT